MSAVAQREDFVLLTSRSQIQAYEACPRLRLLQDHTGAGGLGTVGSGRVPLAQAVPLAKGSTFHKGFEVLLRGHGVEDAVCEALAEYDSLTRERGFAAVADRDQEYTLREQRYLCEVGLRLWAERRLPWFQRTYEVLELEVEAPVQQLAPGIGFQSRADGTLRNRETGLLEVLSFKTASTWRRAQDEENENDVQGISEPWAVSQRHGPVASVLMEYLVLGQRKRQAEPPSEESDDYDGELKEFLQLPKLQDSFLVRPYRVFRGRDMAGNLTEYPEKHDQFAWKLRGRDPLTGKTISANSVFDPNFGTRGKARTESLSRHGEWTPERVFIGDYLPAKEWASRLVNNQVWPYTQSDSPLDRLFVCRRYERHAFELEDWRREAGAQEQVVAEGLSRLRLAEQGPSHYDGQHVLDTFFPRRRKSCLNMYGSPCSYRKVCWGGDDVSGPKFEDRRPNHPPTEEGE